MTNIDERQALVPTTSEELREAAIKRVKAKHDFKTHVVLYVAVNVLLVVIWAMTNAGKSGSQGFFWPIWVMGGWGIAVALNGYAVYHRNPITEDRIAREMRGLERDGRR